jgi:Rrf2 family transcriptional regulator, cysteine metabolism repressor
MRVSTKFRYGLRAMLDIAENETNGSVLVRSIAQRQGISKKYLDNLLVALKNAGLLRSVRGAKGGYSLAKTASQITIADIAEALEGPPNLIDCVVDPSLCPRAETCPTNEFWKEMSESLRHFMAKTTLEDLVMRGAEKKSSAANMYYL